MWANLWKIFKNLQVWALKTYSEDTFLKTAQFLLLLTIVGEGGDSEQRISSQTLLNLKKCMHCKKERCQLKKKKKKKKKKTEKVRF